MESTNHQSYMGITEFCWYVRFVITHASQLISMAIVATGFDLSIGHRSRLHSLRILDKNDEMMPVPGPISNKRDGWSVWRNEYSSSRASKKRNESWSGSYLFMMISSQAIHFGIILYWDVIKRWCCKERRIHSLKSLFSERNKCCNKERE